MGIVVVFLLIYPPPISPTPSLSSLRVRMVRHSPLTIRHSPFTLLVVLLYNERVRYSLRHRPTLLADLMQDLLSYQEGQHTLEDYLKEFKSRCAVIEQYGGTVGGASHHYCLPFKHDHDRDESRTGRRNRQLQDLRRSKGKRSGAIQGRTVPQECGQEV
jgi:hypothetical protein